MVLQARHVADAPKCYFPFISSSSWIWVRIGWANTQPHLSRQLFVHSINVYYIETVQYFHKQIIWLEFIGHHLGRVTNLLWDNKSNYNDKQLFNICWYLCAAGIVNPLQQPYEVGSSITSIFLMRKLSCREVTYLPMLAKLISGGTEISPSLSSSNILAFALLSHFSGLLWNE